MDTFSQASHQPIKEKRKQDYLDYDVSFYMAVATRAQPNTCFDNVLDMYLKYFPHAFSAYGKMIEGWYVVDLEDEVVLNEHGWVEMPSGRIIDPTVILLVPQARPVYYFPGVERPFQEVQAIARIKDAWFPYVRGIGTYGDDGLRHPTYKAAHDMAVQKVFTLANATQPPKRMTFLTAQDLLDDQQDMGMSVQMFIASPEPYEEGQSEK